MTYDSEVLADSPYIYYSTTETSGTITDDSGNGRNLTLPGGSPTYAQTGPGGAADAMNWPDSSGGTEYYGTVSTSSGLVLPMTLECIFYYSGTPPTNLTPLVCEAYGYGNNSQRPVELYLGTDGKIKAMTGSSTSTSNAISASSACTTGWHHAVLAVATGAWKIRMDKVDVATSSTGVSFVGSSSSLFIHGGGSDSNGTVGDLRNGSAVLISKVAVYGSKLSDARIDAHFDAIPQAVIGTLASTLDDVTFVATGEQDFTGTLATTLDDTQLAAVGELGFTGSLTVTLDDATLTASGDVDNGGVTGTLAVTLDDAALAGAGAETFTGTLASTLDDSALTASGLVANPVDGTLATTLADSTLAASGTETFTGSLAVTLDDCTLAATGAETFTGSLVAALDDATFASAGAETIPGTLSTTLADTLLAAVATETIAGLLAVTLDDTVLHAVGNGNVPPSRDITILSVLERLRAVTTDERARSVALAERAKPDGIDERAEQGSATERTRTLTIAERT